MRSRREEELIARAEELARAAYEAAAMHCPVTSNSPKWPAWSALTIPQRDYWSSVSAAVVETFTAQMVKAHNQHGAIDGD